ncbi:MAG: SusC/RagA family TonB-linked outer membrane protein [Saprospiraceae bacterium]|nr:SusC/RagA family TonB-linked outer membrane protein [Saprospiraceae bacterium]
MNFLHTFTRGGLLAAVFLLLGNAALAQRTVTGKVTDAENGEPLIGATVSVVGTTRGAVTDIDGNYSVGVPDGSTQLRFAYTGYKEEVVEIGASNTVDIAMRPGSVLDEVVVIGYGAVRKSDLTGSVVSVGEKDFNQGIFAAPDQLIQGKAAGVQVLSNSGQPGSAATVRIRGNSSIRAGNEPLWVVDGVQLTGSSTKPGTNAGDLGATAPSNPLNFLNPNDIESIQVLKDASATAIYGSRGANGVIIITTKKGKSGTPTIDFNTSVGASSVLRKYDVLDGNEYRAVLRNYGLADGDFGDNVDAFDEITRTGFVQNHGVSVTGGTTGGSYRFGLNYFDQGGIIKENDLKRLSANLSGSFSFLESKRLGLDIGLIASQTRENGPAVSTNAGFRGSLIGNALQWNPTHKLYNNDGTPVIIPDFGNFTNPVALIQAFKDRSNTVDLIGSISPSFKITDALTYRFFYSVNHGVGDRRTQISSWINIQDIEGRGLASFNEVKNTNQILTHSLSYNTNLGRSLNLNAVAGYEYQKRTEKGFGISARDFLPGSEPGDFFDYTNIFQNSSPNNRNVFSYHNPDAELQSFFVRGIFNLSDKYLLTATMRADGSSKFGENNKYGYFPAAALAWNLHNESFLENSVFDNLKLRVGWGQTGNSEFPAGASQGRYGFGNSGGQSTVELENLANPNLKWETTTTTNFGVDFAFMNYKIYGTLEYFNRNTKDLLFIADASLPGPAVKYWTNLPGNLINSGVEASLNALLVDKERVSWTAGFNVTFLKNELTNYDGAEILYGQLFGQGSTGAVSQRLANGQPLNAFYLRQHLGIGEDGQSRFVGGDEETPAFVGDANPNVLLGFYTGATFGKLSMNLNFNGAMGHQIFNNTKMSVIPIGNLGSRNIDANLLGGANREATSNAIKASDRYLEKGDYLKLANATIAYSLGNIGRAFRNARLYVTGQNLFVITKYTGFDPEVNTVNILEGLPSTGIEYIPYPSARTFILGANFSF